MRIVVVSNTTMQPLAPSFPEHDFVFGGVGDLQLWLADPSAPPADPTTDVVLVHADGEALVPPLGPAEGLESTLTLIEQFARAHPATEVIVTSLLVGPRTASSYADALDSGGRVAARSTWICAARRWRLTSPTWRCWTSSSSSRTPAGAR